MRHRAMKAPETAEKSANCGYFSVC